MLKDSKILLVDDEQELVEALAERLTIRGVHARWADNGDDALRLVQDEQFDLAVLDVKMPKWDGVVLARRMKEFQPEMKIVFQTGYGGDDPMERAGEMACACILKPIRFAILLETLTSCMAETPSEPHSA